MTEVPKLTPEQAAILRLSGFVPFTVLMDLQHLGLTDKFDNATELGKVALEAFDAEREREIRDRTLDAIFAGFVETLVDAGIDESKALAEAHSIRARAVEILGSWRKA